MLQENVWVCGDCGEPRSGYRVQTTVFSGAARVDPFGRVWIDGCASEEEHLTAPAIEGKERRGCALLLDAKLLPVEPGVRGKFEVIVKFREE